MLSQVAVEALYSATYVENYLDSVENLPDDVQRHLSRIREIDVQYRGHLRDVDYFYDQWSNCSTNELESTNATTKRTRAMARIQQSLIAAQELGDEKLQIVTQLQELIDHKTRQLEHDFKNLDYSKDEPPPSHLTTDHQSLTAAAAAAATATGKDLLHTSSSASHSPALSSPSAMASSTTAAASAPIFGTAASNCGTIGGSHIPGLTSSSTLAAAAAAAAVGTDRFLNNSNASTASSGAAERSSKRPRRARNDAAASVTGGGSNNNGQSDVNIGTAEMSVDTQQKPQNSGVVTSVATASASSLSTISGAAATSSNAAAGQKKSSGNSTGAAGGGGGTASATNSTSHTATASNASATAGGSSGGNGAGSGGNGGGGGGNGSNRKTKKRKSGRAQAANSSTQSAAAAAVAAQAAAAAAAAAAVAAARDMHSRDTPPAEEAIDPDEPTYCLCDQISFGEMILCDNDLCPIEWFHFSCVSLLSKPKGKWFCPNCRGDRPNVMKPKAQFLKELERYNKEKEEKT